MYAYIKGELVEKRADCAVVEAGGVGYRVITSVPTLARLPAAGAEVRLYTHLVVREDAHALYGFLTKEELAMFEILLPVPKVGPKAAIALLSAFTPSQFSLAVLTEDYKSLAGAKGIGAKNAQAIVLALKDKMRKESALSSGAAAAARSHGSAASAPAASAASAAALAAADSAFGADGAPAARSKFAEAVSALIILGYTALEAADAVACAYSDETELEDVIKNALRASYRV